jgi:hypothetical protein
MAKVDSDWRHVMLSQYGIFGTIASLEVASLGILTQVLDKHVSSSEKQLFFFSSLSLLLEIILILWLINQERKTAFHPQQMLIFRKYEFIYRNILIFIMAFTAALILLLFNVHIGSFSFEKINWETVNAIATLTGSLATFGTLLFLILKDKSDQESEKATLKQALINEMELNVDLLFSVRVENPSITSAFRKLRDKYIGEIDDLETFKEIQKLYAELDYYQKFVDKVYLKLPDSGRPVTERQLEACNMFIKFFDDKPIDFDKSKISQDAGGYIISMRDKAINLKEIKIDKWREIIKCKVDSLF